MFYKLENDEFEKIKEVEKITYSDYEVVGNFIPVESLLYALIDMLGEYHNKEEELEDLKQNIEDNYKPRYDNKYQEYGLSERDFL